jgi:glycosyltransferase involved in cell wall biosynthesis
MHARVRVLLHKPLVRQGELYFRAQQYVAALRRLGHQVEVLDFGRLEASPLGKAVGIVVQIARSLAAFARSDVVILTPHPLVMLYMVLARLLGCRIVLDQILTYISHREVLRWFPARVDRWMYRLPDAIVTHSETMRREIVGMFGIPLERIEVVYPVLDLALFSRRYDADVRQLRKELDLDGRFVVLYHGMWHPWHGLPVVYEAARMLADDPTIAFLVIPRSREHDRGNVRFVDEQPFERLPIFLQMADAWCSGFDSDARGERAFSSTLIQALALGLPVVTGASGERAILLEDRVNARFVPLRDPAALASAIRQLAANPALARALGQHARAFAEGHFSLDRLDAALSAILGRCRLMRRPAVDNARAS